MDEFQNMSRHAERRARQRAISPLAIDLILRPGRSEKAGDGCTKGFLDKASYRQLEAYAGPIAAHLKDYLGIHSVVSSDLHRVTVAHRLDRIHRS